MSAEDIQEVRRLIIVLCERLEAAEDCAMMLKARVAELEALWNEQAQRADNAEARVDILERRVDRDALVESNLLARVKELEAELVEAQLMIGIKIAGLDDAEGPSAGQGEAQESDNP